MSVTDKPVQRKRRYKKRKGSEKRRGPAIPCRCCKAFWFGHEEPSHVKRVLDCYYKQIFPLQQKELVRASSVSSSRAPRDFIGCVKRSILRSFASGLETLDEAQVFQRDMVPYGEPQPLIRTVQFHTWWDEDGLPTRFEEISPSERDVLVQDLLPTASPTFLCALPLYQADFEFEYTCGFEPKEIGYVNSFKSCVYESFLQEMGRPKVALDVVGDAEINKPDIQSDSKWDRCCEKKIDGCSISDMEIVDYDEKKDDSSNIDIDDNDVKQKSLTDEYESYLSSLGKYDGLCGSFDAAFECDAPKDKKDKERKKKGKKKLKA